MTVSGSRPAPGFTLGDIRSEKEYSKVQSAYEGYLLFKIDSQPQDSLLSKIKERLLSDCLLPVHASKNFSYLVHMSAEERGALAQIKEFVHLEQYEEMINWPPSLFARGFWLTSDFSIQLHLIESLTDQDGFVEYFREIQRVYPLASLEKEAASLPENESFKQYLIDVEVLDVEGSFCMGNIDSLTLKKKIGSYLLFLSRVWENNPKKAGIIYKRFPGVMSQPKNSTTLKEAFRKYLTEKCGYFPDDPWLNEIKATLQDPALLSRDLEACAYIIHLSKDERAALYSKVREVPKLDTQKLQKMEQDFALIPKESPFKQYLLGAFQDSFTAFEKQQNIRYCLQVLSRSLGFDLGNDLKACSEITCRILYERFLGVLEKDQTKFLRINKPGKSYERKILETLELLSSLTGVSGLQKLKNALTLKIEEKDLLDFPGMGTDLNPGQSLLEQRDESFNSLCLSMLREVALRRDIKIPALSLYLARELGDFSALENVMAQMPKLMEHIRGKILILCHLLGIPTSPDSSSYDLYRLFKQSFKERCLASQKWIPSNISLEEIYDTQNIEAILLAVPPVAAISPSNTSEEATSPILDETPLPAEDPAPPRFVESPKAFWDWIESEGNDSLFREFVLDKQLKACIGDMDLILFTADLYISLLKKEALVMKEEVPDEISSLEELDRVSNELCYKKFLKGLAFAEKKYGKIAGLQEINDLEISFSEKRSLSIKALEGNVSLQKLLEFLTKPLSQGRVAATLNPIFSSKANKACFSWLSKSSFLASLEAPIGTRDAPNLAAALNSFRDKVRSQIMLLGMPPLCLDLLDGYIEQGDVDGLNRILSAVFYKRYMEVLPDLEDLPAFASTLANDSSLDQVSKSKAKVSSVIKDELLRNYLLFRLEQLPFRSRDLSEETNDLICNYLQHESAHAPFKLYLRENRFSWMGANEEPCDWFCYLYEQFKEKTLKSAKISRFDTTRLLTKEIEHLAPYDFKKLDLIAAFVQSRDGITVEDFYLHGFLRSIESILQTSSAAAKNHQRNFEKIERLSLQKSFLEFFSKSLELSSWVSKAINGGKTRSLHVGFEFLRDLMQKETPRDLSTFFMQYFLRYQDFLRESVFKQEDAEEQKIKEFESLMKEASFRSCLGYILAQGEVVDVKGALSGTFSLIPNYSLEPYIRTIKVFGDINSGVLNPSPYLRGQESFTELLRSTNNLMQPSAENLVTPEVVNSLTRESLKNTLGSFSRCLIDVGIKPMRGMNVHEYYQHYMRLEKEVLEYFEMKVSCLKEEYKRMKAEFKDDSAASYASDEFFRDVLSEEFIRRLRAAVQSRNWDEINESADQIIYMEYRVEFTRVSLEYLQKKKLKGLNQIMDQMQRAGACFSREEAEKTMIDLPEPLKASESKLRAILENSNWIEMKERTIHSTWKWARSKDYLKAFPDIHVDPSTLSLFEKKSILGNIFCALAESFAAEFKELGMHESYRELVKRAFYEDSCSLWDWLAEEITYKKCLLRIEEARIEGKEIPEILGRLKEDVELTVYEKVNVVLKSGCHEIIDSMFSKGNFTLALKAFV